MSQQFKLRKYELEPMTDDRVTVAVECCGVCGSVRAPSPRSAITLSDPFVQQDQHTISGGWGPFETGFVVTGHEVIGTVAEVGSKVTEFKVGQRVGVGAQVGGCGECKACKNDNGPLYALTALSFELTLLSRELLPSADARLQYPLYAVLA